MLHIQSFAQLLLEASSHFGDRSFLIDDERLGPVSYVEVLNFAKGLAQSLDELKIPRGAAVGILLHNSGIAALLFLAVIATRRVLVPLNPLSKAYELEYMLSQAECTTVIVDPLQVNPAICGARQIIPIPDHGKYFSDMCSRSAGRDLRSSLARNLISTTGEIVFTSGSLGRPKGVVLSELNLISNASALAEVYGLGTADRFLTVCPLFHNSGQIFTTLVCALVGGSTAAIKSDVGMFNFWSYVDKYRANWSFGMLSLLALLLSRPNRPKQPCTMRGLLTGGSPIDAALIEGFESRFRIPVRTVYGLTETTSISTCEFDGSSPRSLGSSGSPLKICDVRIGATLSALAKASELPSRERGEIWISGPNVFESYIGNTELTRIQKHDGWLRTGDLGYFDGNGNLFVIDRLDSMLIVGGENIYPAEIERLGLILPGAAQIVLSSIEDPIFGKELILVYKSASDAAPPVSVWHRIFNDYLSPAKVPQRYVRIEDIGLYEFPRKHTGKLDRVAVATLLRRKFQPRSAILSDIHHKHEDS